MRNGKSWDNDSSSICRAISIWVYEPKTKPKVFLDKKGIKRVSGNEGIGIPVMKLAYMAGINDAKINGISALSIRDVGHTGRHGVFQILPLKRGYYQFALAVVIDKLEGKLLHMEG